MYFNEIRGHFMRRPTCVSARLNSLNKGIFIGEKNISGTGCREKLTCFILNTCFQEVFEIIKHNELNAS
jgi:hypothetical protein